ncbi:UNVERIFIED_CONTAM: hypothetical protein Scaly_0900100 [Sesamum calycinum]|uniref:Uncharacterized protein n=1 Tax=Sesamum calycinum TaxID=2727403 RepID=A0AAW2QVW9_9LAMI
MTDKVHPTLTKQNATRLPPPPPQHLNYPQPKPTSTTPSPPTATDRSTGTSAAAAASASHASGPSSSSSRSFSSPLSPPLPSTCSTNPAAPHSPSPPSPDTISVIHTAMALNSQLLDADSVKSLNSDLKRKNGLPMRIVMDTTVRVKMEKTKMKKIGIRVKCDGIRGVVPKGKRVIPAVANISNAKCEVDLRTKILKWTF